MIDVRYDPNSNKVVFYHQVIGKLSAEKIAEFKDWNHAVTELKGESKKIVRDYAIWQAINDLESRCRHRSSGLQIEIEDKEHEPVVQAALLILAECGVDVIRDAKFPNIKINYDRSQNQFFGRG